jgi:predicted negative regulator of RcsB-dependent stress response
VSHARAAAAAVTEVWSASVRAAAAAVAHGTADTAETQLRQTVSRTVDRERRDSCACLIDILCLLGWIQEEKPLFA